MSRNKKRKNTSKNSGKNRKSYESIHKPENMRNFLKKATYFLMGVVFSLLPGILGVDESYLVGTGSDISFNENGGINENNELLVTFVLETKISNYGLKSGHISNAKIFLSEQNYSDKRADIQLHYLYKGSIKPFRSKKIKSIWKIVYHFSIPKPISATIIFYNRSGEEIFNADIALWDGDPSYPKHVSEKEMNIETKKMKERYEGGLKGPY